MEIDFSGIGNEAAKDELYTPLTTSIAQGSVSFDYGPSAGSRLTDRGFNDFSQEFNLQNWSTGTNLTDAINDTAFVSLAVNPVEGLSVELLSVGFNFWRNGVNSPRDYAILTNLNGFDGDSALNTITNLNTGGSIADQVRLEADGISGQTTTSQLEIRLYGWNAPATSGHTHITVADVHLRFATVAGLSFNPTGSLEILGDFFHLEGGNIEIGVGGVDNSDLDDLQFDFIQVAGKVLLAGDLTLREIDGFVPTEGDQITFLTGNAIFGTFDSVTVDGFEGWNVNLIYTATGVAAEFTAIPEPTGARLLGAALIVCGYRRRR